MGEEEVVRPAERAEKRVARDELEKAGIELLGSTKGDATQWVHFQGPDGNIYELTNGRGGTGSGGY